MYNNIIYSIKTTGGRSSGVLVAEMMPNSVAHNSGLEVSKIKVFSVIFIITRANRLQRRRGHVVHYIHSPYQSIQYCYIITRANRLQRRRGHVVHYIHSKFQKWK